MLFVAGCKGQKLTRTWMFADCRDYSVLFIFIARIILMEQNEFDAATCAQVLFPRDAHESFFATRGIVASLWGMSCRQCSSTGFS